MAETTMTPAQYLCNPDVVLREEDEDGGLLFNPDTNQVKIVNITGLYIWKKCDGSRDAAGILTTVLQDFEDVPVDTVKADVEEFLEGMLQTGFIGTTSPQ